MTDNVEPHILTKYELVKKVGSGAYGHVWKVTDKKTGQVLALKKIFDAFQHSTDAQRTYREIMFLHEFKHENIIKLFNVFKAENDKDLYLIFQFMEADLHNAIGQKILKDVHNRFVMYQIFKGIKYLHSASVIHRDLKPSNILINSDCHIKICDFGLARSLKAEKSDKDMVLTEQVATRWYRAPEVLLGSNFYDSSADIWSIGCILAEILTGKPFFAGNSTLNQLQKILSFTGNPSSKDIESLDSDVAETMIKSANISKSKSIKDWFKSGTPSDAIDLVVQMLQFNPNNRPKIEQILKHPYLSQFRDAKSEVESKRIISPPISDNKKLNLKQYRCLIYESLRSLFKGNGSQQKPSAMSSSVNHSVERRTPAAGSGSVVESRTSNSISRHHRQHSREKSTDHNSYHYSNTPKHFTSSSVHRSGAGSNYAYQHHSGKKVLNNSYSQNSIGSLHRHRNSHEEQKAKRKGSLKELLMQRRTPMKSEKERSGMFSSTGSLHYTPGPTSSHQMSRQYKYYKSGVPSSQKEGETKYCFGRA